MYTNSLHIPWGKSLFMRLMEKKKSECWPKTLLFDCCWLLTPNVHSPISIVTVIFHHRLQHWKTKHESVQGLYYKQAKWPKKAKLGLDQIVWISEFASPLRVGGLWCCKASCRGPPARPSARPPGRAASLLQSSRCQIHSAPAGLQGSLDDITGWCHADRRGLPRGSSWGLKECSWTPRASGEGEMELNSNRVGEKQKHTMTASLAASVL